MDKHQDWSIYLKKYVLLNKIIIKVFWINFKIYILTNFILKYSMFYRKIIKLKILIYKISTNVDSKNRFIYFRNINFLNFVIWSIIFTQVYAQYKLDYSKLKYNLLCIIYILKHCTIKEKYKKNISYHIEKHVQCYNYLINKK